MMTLYGIKNCDTVKKSLQWFTSNGIAIEFHDYKTMGITEEKLKSWIKQVGWESLINKKGTTWRNLDESLKERIKDDSQAIAIIKSQTSVIKRPVVEEGGIVKAIGFDEKEYSMLFNSDSK